VVAPLDGMAGEGPGQGPALNCTSDGMPRR
jgi:hypothetical protein